MKKITVLFPIIFILVLLFSCGSTASAVKQDPSPQVSSGQPSWVGTSKKDKDYFYAVGYVEDTAGLDDVKAKAFQNAKGQIANNIFEETSVEKVFTASGGLSDNEELKKGYQEKVRSESAVNLSGVEIEDVYSEKTEDSGLTVYKVWVLAKISYKNLEKERNRVITELQRKLALVDNNIKAAQGFTNGGRIIDAVNAYITAAVSSTKVKERTDEFPIYVSKAEKLLEGIIIEAQDNPSSIDTVKGGVFGFKVTYASPSGKIPLSGAKINFVIKNNDGEYEKSGVSATNGVVECRIKKLKEVKSDNRLYAVFSFDFPDILDLGKEYQKYYSSLKDSEEKISVYTEFKTISRENRNIPTTVIAMIAGENGLKNIPGLSAEAQSYLIDRGYKVVKFSGSLPLEDIAEVKQSALEELASKGIKRVFILSVASQASPKYNQELDRYLGVYSVSAQLVDTSSGEIISSKNIKVSATAQTESGVFDSFIKAAGNQIKNLIE